MNKNYDQYVYQIGEIIKDLPLAEQVAVLEVLKHSIIAAAVNQYV